MTLGTSLLLLSLAAVAYALVTAVLRVLGNWSNYAISRHDLIVESRARRFAYYDALAERKGLSNNTVEVLDE